MSNPLLSVIVPVYNKEKVLSRCLESIINQKYKNLDIIIVDDGSQDKSYEIAKSFEERDSRIRVFKKENEGLGFTRNYGLKLARGDFFTFVDSDDYIDDSMYLEMIENLDETIDIVYCDFAVEDTAGKICNLPSNLVDGKFSNVEICNAILGALPESNRDFEFDMSVCKGIFRKKIIDDYNICFKSEREYICEDLYFDLEYLKYVRNVYFLKKYYYHYVMYSNSITHSYVENRLGKETFLYKKVNSIIKSDYDGETLLRYNRMFLGRVRCCIRQEVFKKQTLKKCLSSIKGIISDDVVSTVINSYPISRCSITLRVFNTCIKYKLSIALYFLIKIKEEM